MRNVASLLSNIVTSFASLRLSVLHRYKYEWVGLDSNIIQTLFYKEPLALISRSYSKVITTKSLGEIVKGKVRHTLVLWS